MRRVGLSVPLAILVILSLVIAGSALVSGFAQTSAAPTGVPGSGAPSVSLTPATSPPASGPGTFWDNQLIPTPGAANESCTYLSTCMNDTGGPSIASTNAGVIAVAYTAFTNASACPASANITFTEIGVTVSLNTGSTWSAPIYLGNPDCVHAFEFTSAISPSIAILGNGTFALVYIEYNASSTAACSGYIYYPAMNPCFLPYDDLVITYSYNDGATWTDPQVLNATTNTGLATNAPVPEQPRLAAVGDTLYVAWTNFSYPEYDNSATAPSIGLNLVVSTDGGAAWGSPTQLPIQAGAWGSGVTWVGYAPALLINSTGELVVAYSTALDTYAGNYCDAYGCSTLYPPATESVVVARSSDNGSTFTMGTVATGVPVDWNGNNWANNGPGTLVSPAPAIATDPATGQLFVAYAGGEVGTVCSALGSCTVGEEFTNIWVANSTDGGGTWSAPIALGDAVLGLSGTATGPDNLFLPSIGVDANGTVFVDAAQENDSACVGYNCGLQSDLIFESTDHGASFAAWYTPYPEPTINGYPLWDGMSSSMTTVNGEPFMAWTLEVCPGNGVVFPCGAPSAYSWSQVVVSSPFTGVGVNVTFTQTGLPAQFNWSASLSGNVRSGPATGSLVVSGVPTGLLETWSASWVNTTTYGLLYQSNFTLPSPGTFATNTTLAVSYGEVALVTISTVPPGDPGQPFNCPPGGFYAYDCASESVAPFVGSSWVPIGSTLSYGIGPSSAPLSTCGQCMNVSFIRWTGTGSGGWSSTITNGSTVVNGPVNETASFNLWGICDLGVCTNVTYQYTFTEVGLPSASPWTVTFGDQTGTSTQPSIGFNASQGPVNFTVWVVPHNATYAYYASPSTPSPLSPLAGGQDLVRFSLEPIVRESSPITVRASGLPPGVSTWNVQLGTVEYAVSGNGTFELPNGPVDLAAPSVFGPADIGARLTGFTIEPETVGAANYSVSGGTAVNLSGPAVAIANFAPEYWLSVASGPGGTVSGPTGAWIPSGAAVDLNASPSAGNAWVGWSGTGRGSYSGTSENITIHPTAPVAELATFAAVPLSYTLTVVTEGLPAGTPVTVSMGPVNYSEIAPFAIAGLAVGSYTVDAPTLYPNATTGIRYPVASLASTLPLSGGTLVVSADGTLTIDYSSEVSLYVGTADGGTTNPPAGTSWVPNGSELTLVESPAPGYVAGGWNGSGPGSATAGTSSITFTPTGPVTESPLFLPYIAPPPRTYNLTLTESGLPDGIDWGAAVGSEGTYGVSASLVLSGLNGSFTLIVPTVPGTIGVRYVPAPSNSFAVRVSGDRAIEVNFTVQYLVSVTAATGGTVSTPGGWVNASSTETLTAMENASWTFVSWSGNGTGAYSGTMASTTVTVTAPISEVAEFAPVPTGVGPSGGPGPAAYALPVGLLLVLLAVGLLIGYVLVRRSRGPPGAEAPTEPGPEAEYELDPESPSELSEEQPPTPE
jgi:hypothetical protein